MGKRQYSPIQMFMSIGHKTKDNYVLNSVTLLEELSITQREAVKKAIEWLVAKAPHTAEEIADHFDVTVQLVTVIVECLEKEGRVRTYRNPAGEKLITNLGPSERKGK